MRNPVNLKYAFLLLLLGGALAGLAWGGAWGGVWCLILWWFSLSLLLLTLGYGGVGSRIFGKRRDGKIPIWSKAVHFPFLLLSWVVWNLVRVSGRESAVDRVNEGLLVGRRLRGCEVPVNIDNYVDLTSEMEDPSVARSLPGYKSFPVLDGCAPDPDALRNAARAIPLRDGEVTFVHCAQGRGRSGLFALALLLERGEISSFDQGMRLLKKARPGLTLSHSQESFMRKYISRFGAASG